MGSNDPDFLRSLGHTYRVWEDFEESLVYTPHLIKLALFLVVRNQAHPRIRVRSWILFDAIF